VQTDLDERLAEGGRLCGEANVAGERQIEAGAVGRAINGGDDRLHHLPDGREHAAARAEQTRELVHVVTLHQFVHVLDVGSGAKSPSGAGDDDDAYRLIARRPLQRLGQVAPHVPGKGVQLFGTVQSDGRYPGLGLDSDVFVHGDSGI
jgi:hypothetical protein